MNGNKALLDSNVLIFLSKGMIDLASLRSKYSKFHVSIITYMEVYAFNFQDETQKDILDRIFNNLEIVEINNDIADQTITYRKNKTKKIKLPDAVILATAKIIGADLTYN